MDAEASSLPALPAFEPAPLRDHQSEEGPQAFGVDPILLSVHANLVSRAYALKCPCTEDGKADSTLKQWASSKAVPRALGIAVNKRALPQGDAPVI